MDKLSVLTLRGHVSKRHSRGLISVEINSDKKEGKRTFDLSPNIPLIEYGAALKLSGRYLLFRANSMPER